MDMLKLHMSLSCNFTFVTRCPCGLVGFRNKNFGNHLVGNRFGLPGYVVTELLVIPNVLLKTHVFVATSTDGKCSHSMLQTSRSFTLINVETP